MDFQTYSHLYGFQYPQVLKYCKKVSHPLFDKKLTTQVDEGIEGGIFSVLNAHATLLAQSAEGKEISSAFKQAFRSFLTIAENSYPFTPVDDMTRASSQGLIGSFGACISKKRISCTLKDSYKHGCGAEWPYIPYSRAVASSYRQSHNSPKIGRT